MIKYAIYNPHNKLVDELPVIYGFNNGGSIGLCHGQLIAEDGKLLGDHVCSHEAYMYSDLGLLAGHRLDRHEGFKKHYPDGYRMDFVSYNDVDSHDGLQKAFRLYHEKYPALADE